MITPRWLRPGLAALAAAVLLQGCGYRVAGTGALPGGARAVRVPVLRNLTMEPGVEAWFTAGLRDEFARAGQLGGELADATLEGEVTSVTSSVGITAEFRQQAQEGMPAPVPIARPASYRVYATVVMRLMRDGKELGRTTVAGSEEYLPGIPASAPQVLKDPASNPDPYLDANREVPSLSESNKRLALRRLASTLARQAYANLTSAW